MSRYSHRRPTRVMLFAAFWVLVAAGPSAGQVLAPPVHASDALFDSPVLHDINLLINSRDWETLKVNYLSNAYYPADLRWQGQVVRNIGIRSRGTGSRSGIKPGLRLDFDRYTTDQKFLGLSSIVLRNNVQDPSGLHESVSMAFFRRMGVAAPREVQARLFVNNVFAGVYTVVESVDKGFLTRTFGENDGYLYDYDYDATDLPYLFEYRGPDPGAYVPKPFKPETHDNKPKPEFFERLAWTIEQTGDALFQSSIATYIDVAAFIRHAAVTVFVADNDGVLGDYGMNNFYLYRSDFLPGFVPIGWDKSQAFFVGPAYSIWHNLTDVPPEYRNRLFSRLLAFPEWRNLYLATLKECALSASEIPPGALPTDKRGWLELEIERQSALIYPHQLADKEKPYTNLEVDAALDAMRFFARERSAFVSAEVAQAQLLQP